MLGRISRSLLLVMLVIAVLAPGAAAQAPGSSDHLEHVLTARVPLVARMVVDQGQDGIPVVHLVTNDPTWRASAGGGLAPEMVVAGTVSYEALGGHGGAASLKGWVSASPTLLLYTAVSP